MVAVLRPRTQGQHDVLFDKVQPYTAFPKVVKGPTVWQAEQFRSRRDLWTKRWSPEHIHELEEAYSMFKASRLPITAITKVCLSRETAPDLDEMITALPCRTHSPSPPVSPISCVQSEP
jgi:hypothetical protein